MQRAAQEQAMTDRFELVPFHQHQILTVKTDTRVLVIMKPIVEALGLQWRAQWRRIMGHPVLSKGVSLKEIPSAGGMQAMLALDLEQFHGWLITLSPERVTDEAKREVILRYQAEAFRVVFEHFHGKIGRPPRTAKSIGSTIAVQNHALRIAHKLQSVYHPTERRMMHQMLDALCQDIGIDTPPLEALGHDAPQVSDRLDQFWNAVDVLVERGHRVNQSRKAGLIALHLPTLAKAMAAERIDFRSNSDLHRVLEQSTSPGFVAQKPVNCRDGQTRHCWVFAGARASWATD